MKSVKLYQSNIANLLMYFDSRKDIPFVECGYQLEYEVAMKADNPLYIRVNVPRNYEGKLGLSDFCFSATAHRLLTYIRELHTRFGTAKLDFSIRDYMRRCELIDRKQTRRQLDRDLFSLFCIVYDAGKGRSAILSSYSIHHGRVFVELYPGFVDEITSHRNLIYLPLAYYSIDRQQYPASADMLYQMLVTRHMNSNKSNRDILSIESLLRRGRFPGIDEVRASKNNAIRARIKVPFFRNLNSLRDILRCTYYTAEGDSISARDAANLPYEDFIRVKVHFWWKFDDHEK